MSAEDWDIREIYNSYVYVSEKHNMCSNLARFSDLNKCPIAHIQSFFEKEVKKLSKENNTLVKKTLYNYAVTSIEFIKTRSFEHAPPLLMNLC